MFQLLENLLERELTDKDQEGSGYLINSRVTTVGPLSSYGQKQKIYIQKAKTVTGPLWCESNVYFRQNINFN